MDTVLAYIRHPFIEYSYHIKLKWNDFVANYDKTYDVPRQLEAESTSDFFICKVHEANMGPTWVLSATDGPHVGPMDPAIRDIH